jgi:hypothetical protein
MSGIQERLQQLQPYVLSIRYFEGLPVIEVFFKERWTVPESEIIRKEKVDENSTTYMFFSQHDGIGIDELLDYAEDIINMNIEKEQKNELLRVKVKELQKFFVENSLSELEGMTFQIGKKKITNEFNPNDISIDDEIEVPKVETKPEPVLEPVLEMAEVEPKKPAQKSTQKIVNSTKIELPPKPSNGKIEVEGDQIPAEAKEGPCSCDWCIKCVDERG